MIWNFTLTALYRSYTRLLSGKLLLGQLGRENNGLTVLLSLLNSVSSVFKIFCFSSLFWCHFRTSIYCCRALGSRQNQDYLLLPQLYMAYLPGDLLPLRSFMAKSISDFRMWGSGSPFWVQVLSTWLSLENAGIWGLVDLMITKMYLSLSSQLSV